MERRDQISSFDLFNSNRLSMKKVRFRFFDSIRDEMRSSNISLSLSLEKHEERRRKKLLNLINLDGDGEKDHSVQQGFFLNETSADDCRW